MSVSYPEKKKRIWDRCPVLGIPRYRASSYLVVNCREQPPPAHRQMDLTELDARLQRAIRGWQKAETWDTPQRAHGCCGSATDAFIAYLGEYDIVAVPLRVRDPVHPPVLETGLLPYMNHDLVWVVDYDVCIDWTARQYWPSAPYPMIISREAFHCWWRDVYIYDQNQSMWIEAKSWAVDGTIGGFNKPASLGGIL